jgi:hypothetical protein
MSRTRLQVVAWVVLLIALPVLGAPPQNVDTPPQFLGRWTVVFQNGVIETCIVWPNGTATESEPARSAKGEITASDQSIVIRFADDRLERWTIVGKRIVVEHWCPAAAYPGEARVLGIAERTIMLGPNATRPDFRPSRNDLTEKQLDELWADLCGKDEVRAQKAVFTLAAGAQQSIRYLRNKAKPAEATRTEKLTAKLIRDLDDDAFEVRERATTQLFALGKETAWLIRRAAESATSVEVRTRLATVVNTISPILEPSGDQLQDARIIEVLEYIGSADARDLLAKLAGGDESALTSQLAKEAIGRLKP